MTDDTNEPAVDGSSNGDTNDATNGASVPTQRRRLVPILAVVIALVVGAVGIGIATGGDEDAQPTTTTSTETTLPPVEQKVLADYRAFWDAYLEASNPMRPDHPALAAHSTGDQYAKLVESFTALKSGDEIIKGTIDLDPRVQELTPTRAVVRDCSDDHTGVYDATTGVRKDEDDPRKHLSTAAMELVGDTWKVSRVSLEGFGCTAP